MSLNIVLNRIKQIAEAHRQVRFYEQKFLSTDFSDDEKVSYPAIFLQVVPGSISTTKKETVYNFIMFIEDLVNVSQDTKLNERDVISDTVQIAEDMIAQMKNPEYSDWRVGPEFNLQLAVESGNDMTAGCAIEFSISTMFVQDRCAVPSDLVVDPINDNDVKVYDVKYTTTGTEGSTLDTEATGSVLNVVTGKKIILITRESTPIYKVSSNPDPLEFTWNDVLIGLGTAVNPIGGERFLILYRNY